MAGQGQVLLAGWTRQPWGGTWSGSRGDMHHLMLDEVCQTGVSCVRMAFEFTSNLSSSVIP